MDAISFYDEKNISHRNLQDGLGLKNTHNFIKAVLIKRFISSKSRILDLGCGQGGDLIKIKYTQPSLYIGIDSSHTAITGAQKRCNNLKLKYRCKFFVLDFTKNSNWGDNLYNVINSQFSVHFAFENDEKANFTFKNISKYLCEDGLFIGTIPNHSQFKTSEEVTVKLPGDDRYCKEYAVTSDDFIKMCEKYGLSLILFESFDIFFQKAKISENNLFVKMNADFAPDSNNFVFCFQKRT